MATRGALGLEIEKRLREAMLVCPGSIAVRAPTAGFRRMLFEDEEATRS